MAYLVITIGALMAMAGGYLVNYGYSIVQVERGWSSVIAGAVFLTGGLLAIGLGLLLRAIVEVRRSLVAGRPTAMAPTGLVPTTASRPEMPIAPSFGDPEARAPMDVGASRAPPAFETRASEPAARSSHDDAPLPDLSYDAAPGSNAQAALATTMPVTPPREREPLGAAPHAIVAADERAPEVMGARAPHLDAPDIYAPDLDAPNRDAPVMDAPVMDDWLDRAFSDLDRESQSFIPAGAGAAVAEATRVEMPIAVPLVVEPPREEPSRVAEADLKPAAAAEAAHSEPGPAAPPPEAYSSPVIGRYESDDTSYVMYADGSIEAQSQAGVYRFSSMAELKAFIEG